MLKKVYLFVLAYFFVCQISGIQEVVPFGGVKWYSLSEAIKMAEKEPRPIILDVYTDWNTWSKYMVKTTYSDKGISNYINANFYAAKLNAETNDTIEFQGRKYFNRQIGRNPTHDLASSLLDGVLTYPTVIFFDTEGKKMVVPGYKESKDLEPYLVYFAEKLGNVVSINDFIINYMFSFPKAFEKDHSIFNVENSLKPDTTGKISWTSPENIIKLNRKRKKPILLYFYDDSCVSCKVMEHTSFGNKELAKKINTYYHPVKINVTDHKPINFLGKSYSCTGGKETNELIQQFLNKNCLMPAIAILDENYNQVTSINGYLLTKYLIPLTDYFFNKVYKKHSFQEYIKNYTTSVPDQNGQ